MEGTDNKLTYRLTLLLVAVAGILFLLLVEQAYRVEVARESDRQLSEAASSMQRHLAVRLHHLTLVAADLRAFLLTQPTPPNSRFFADFSATLRHHYPEIDALVYVGPDRVIRDIHPRAGNERAIGLDLSKRPYAAYIETAIREHKLVVDPPHTMSNGRLAVIARQPVFRDERFLGLAQAVLHVPDIVESELHDLGSAFNIQLRDENGKLFWGDESLAGSVESREVVVGDVAWALSVAQAQPPALSTAVLVMIWGVGGLLLLLTLMSVRSSHRMRQVLKTEVADATRELRQRNEVLQEQIGRRMAAEHQLQRSEQRLREAQQIAHIGNWEWDMATNRIHWSDELYRIFGLAPQAFEPTFEDFHSRVHPDDRAALQQGVAEAMACAESFAPEHRIVRPDGEIRFVRGVGIFERDSTGNPLRVAGTVQDITAEKRALMALQASEHKYRAVLENASDGIIIASAEGEVLDVNRRIQKLLGYSRDELLTLHVSAIHPPEDADKLRAAFTSMREHGFSLFEHLLLRKDGTTTPVEVAGTLITFDNQQVALGIFRDIRERKRTEAELHQHRNHLEQLVEQRTAELVALNGELEAFSYSVSHDLRAPLRAINGFSVALREDFPAQLSSTGHEYLQRIISATERMGRLIDDLLNLSCAMRAEMHCETVPLGMLAAELIEELATLEPGRRVRTIIASDVVATGDPTLLRALLQNLLSNAWKFTRRRDEAEIEFGATIRADHTVYFVRDNGIGFETSQASELFKPFHRLHGVSEYEGSGIGLATVQRIVQRHGGKVWAESEPGQGATFSFTLGEASGRPATPVTH